MNVGPSDVGWAADAPPPPQRSIGWLVRRLLLVRAVQAALGGPDGDLRPGREPEPPQYLLDEIRGRGVLADGRATAIEEAVTRLEPDCILLDGGAGQRYGESWDTAALIATRLPPVPVIMFTAHSGAAAEAREKTSTRSQAARFASLVLKPFELDDLVRAARVATGRSAWVVEAWGWRASTP